MATTETAMAAPEAAGQGQPPNTSQVRVQLTTRDADIALPQETGPILVSTGLRRYALSTLVNTLLESPKPVPFEFLINGSFLRTSIDEYLTANGISSETTLTVEYVRALIPPLYLASFEHDDWVSSIDVLSRSSPAAAWHPSHSISAGQERILSGSYDGLLRIWNMSSQTLATSPSAQEGGHTAPIKAAKFLSPTTLVSSGLDRTVRLWKYAESTDSLSATITPTLELYGHTASVDSLAVHDPSHRILSASADHTLALWSTSKSSGPEAPETLLPSTTSSSAKRRKLHPATSTAKRGALSTLKSHTAPVTRALFHPHNPTTAAYSVSLDHTLQTWDLSTSTSISSRTTAHALLSLTALPALHLVAAGSAARHVVLIDPRASATSIAALTLRGHANAVVDLAPDPASEFGLVSASHDGTCRVWDVRSTRADTGSGSGPTPATVGESVYVISRESRRGKEAKKVVGGEGVKVFGVCWDREVGIVSAGEDRRVQINSGKSVVGGGGSGGESEKR
ncbi:MAG: ribosome biogenesis protein ytm1 [Sarea resinae]|nr:MAG: ribosome biogenesis protein ytm1 [Sarea resinae]